MGSGCTCQSSIENEESDRIRLHRQGNLTFYIHERMVSGKGCKKTPAWQTSMTREEIDGKIKEFWDTRVEGSALVWTILQQACAEPDPEKVDALVKTYNLTMNNGLLQQTYDERGYRYDLPAFVINPAVKYGDAKIIVKAQPHVRSENLNLVFRAAGREDIKLSIKSDEKVEVLKGKVMESLKIDKPIRLFFNGKEMKSESLVGHCKIPDNIVVQVFIKP